MSLRIIKELQDDVSALRTTINNASDWGITKANLLDLFDRILDILSNQEGVAATIRLNRGTTVNSGGGSWERLDLDSPQARDIQGITAGIDDVSDPGTWFEIENAAAGDYTVSVWLRIEAATVGTYRIRVASALNEGAESTLAYEDAYVTSSTDEEFTLSIAEALVRNITEDKAGVATDNRILIQINTPNSASYTPVFCTFSVKRVQ